MNIELISSVEVSKKVENESLHKFEKSILTVIQHRVTCPPILITAMVNSPRHAELEPRLSCCIKLRDVIFEHVDLVILYEDSNFNIMNPNEINLARDAPFRGG